MRHLYYNSSGTPLRIPNTIVDIIFKCAPKTTGLEANDFLIWLITRKCVGAEVHKVSAKRFQVIFPYETLARKFYEQSKIDLITRRIKLRPAHKNKSLVDLFGSKIALNLTLAKIEGKNLEQTARIYLYNGTLHKLETPYADWELDDEKKDEEKDEEKDV